MSIASSQVMWVLLTRGCTWRATAFDHSPEPPCVSQPRGSVPSGCEAWVPLCETGRLWAVHHQPGPCLPAVCSRSTCPTSAWIEGPPEPVCDPGWQSRCRVLFPEGNRSTVQPPFPTPSSPTPLSLPLLSSSTVPGLCPSLSLLRALFPAA